MRVCVYIYIEKKATDTKKKIFFKNGRNQSDVMILEVFENQYEGMMREQSRLSRQVSVYVSIHHLDHLLIYQHILQHISLQHSHIENHCYHDLKIKKHILVIELSEKGELYSILESHPLAFRFL